MKKINSIVILLITVATGYVINHPLIFRICGNTYQFKDYTGCLDSSIKSIGSPLFIFSLWMLFIAVVTAFFSGNIFNSWLKLTAWAIPLSIIFIALVPVSSPGTYLDLFPFYRDDAARLAGEIFAVASLALITWKFLTTRRHQS